MSGVYIALDLEATGMDPERDEIIEIAAIKFRDDRILDRWETLVRPRGPISFNITSLTGIGAKDVRRAPVFNAMAPRLQDFVRNHPIVGQSPQFDIEMLTGAGLRLRNPLYDTFQLATILIPDLPAYNLSTIAARLGISVPQQHRAMADVETTMAVFLGLLDLLKGYDETTLERLAEYAIAAGSPLSRLFKEVLREMKIDDDGLVGSSLGEALLAKISGVRHGPEVMFLLQRERPERLAPTGETEPVDIGQFETWTQPDGLLTRTFPGYEPRSQQTEMMGAVMEALNEGGQYVIEAGTGTGKSLAYLIPAILHAVKRGEPVVVSTNTIALQDQLFRKDLPDLRRTLQAMAKEKPELKEAANFKAALLKGRSNYLCLRRWLLAQREPVTSREEASLHAKILTWAQQTNSGDRAELHLSPDEYGYWNRLSEEEGACVPGRCVFHRRNQCFLFRARHQAESAHVVVVNHALLLSDMLASNTVLPTYRHLIIDEAHNLEDEATSQLGYVLARSRVTDFLQNTLTVERDGSLGGALGNLWRIVSTSSLPLAREMAEQLQPRITQASDIWRPTVEQAEQFFRQLADFVVRYNEERHLQDQRLRLTTGVRHDAGWGEVELSLEALTGSMRELIEILTWSERALDTIISDDFEGSDDLATELDLLIRTGHQYLEQLVAAVSEPSPEVIYWLSRRQTTGEVSIEGAPLHVGAALQEHLFDRCRTVVLTSATMTTEGSFSFIRNRLGLDDPAELQVPSPFDYRRSTLLFLADDIPEPGQHGFQRRLNETLIELCRATRGRAMVLFTSHSALQSTYRAVKRPLEAEGILVLGQRLDGNPRQLVERLKSHPETILLGTNSFWEGVDIVGDALSLLVISKLPFSVPSDPVFAARSEAFDDPFHEYAIPQAILRFKQGFGRLIRSTSDRGVCAVLDRRIVSRRYGQAFVRSLPDCTVETRSTNELPELAEDWLQARSSESPVRLTP